MDSFFRETTEDIELEMLDDSEILAREKILLEEAKKDKEQKKKVSMEKIKEDNDKLIEKFEGLARFFFKASKEDLKNHRQEDFSEKVRIRKEAVDAIKQFNKFDHDILQFINRMTDCIYERDVTREDFLKMSDRQYRDLRQKIEADTDKIRDAARYDHTNSNKNYITLTKEQAYRYSLEMDRKYEDTMRRLSREIEETIKRKFTTNLLIGSLAVLGAPITLGISLYLYVSCYGLYWFKAWRTIEQVKKFRRNYKERYSLIKTLLKG